MATGNGLIRTEGDSTISFGDYTLDKKTKEDNFEYHGDIYKVKTFKEITKLEKNGMFVYESVPGTAVEHLKQTAESVEFMVEGPEDVQITLELQADAFYQVFVNNTDTGMMQTNLGGKLTVSVELEAGKPVPVKVIIK